MIRCRMPLVTSGRNVVPGTICRSTAVREINEVPLCWTHAAAVDEKTRSLSEIQSMHLAIGSRGTKDGGCRPWILKKPKNLRERRRAAAALRKTTKKRKKRKKC